MSSRIEKQPPAKEVRLPSVSDFEEQHTLLCCRIEKKPPAKEVLLPSDSDRESETINHVRRCICLSMYTFFDSRIRSKDYVCVVCHQLNNIWFNDC
jgi:hypothetical protein